MRSYENQLSFYREMVPSSLGGTGTTDTSLPPSGSASLEAPAVLQRTVFDQGGVYVYGETERVGLLLNVTVQNVHGRGRVLVKTTPLMGTTIQDAPKNAA